MRSAGLSKLAGACNIHRWRETGRRTFNFFSGRLKMARRKTQLSLKETDETVEENVHQQDICRPTSYDNHDSKTHEKTDPNCRNDDYFRAVFGFDKLDLTSWHKFVRLLCRPCDPAALGVQRFLFGLLMTVDVVEERGLASADVWWGKVNEGCSFPLFNFMRPLSLQWMYVIYLVMLTGAVGVMLGLKLRLSCALYLVCYWYLLLLDKTSWNNHSYLFGILAFLFAISDANRYLSMDALLDSKINNAHIPLWNYTLMRVQIFIVYFIAGLKKLDQDWLSGYSMQSLAQHWVFNPFKILLTDDQIDLYIVHIGGLLIDLFLGFFLFFDKTRTFALIISTSFHLMNSQIFRIGMFPYAMLATQFHFCDMKWPRRFFKIVLPNSTLLSLKDVHLQTSSSCIYSKEDVKSETLSDNLGSPCSQTAPPTSITWKHIIGSLFTTIFIAWQFVMPYSHGITKGYNNWTNGLYGYSWDMMVHSWSVQHIRITYHNKDSGEMGYLDPNVWTGGEKRWSSHGDMIKQYANCIAENLKSYDIKNVSLYFDIWRSLNNRFQQRMVNPKVDILTAEWSPFKISPWVMPLMVDLSDWRNKLEEIQSMLSNESYKNVVFVADFPGMVLENYIQSDLGNTNITVLLGTVLVELLKEKENVTLGPGQSLQIKADTFHNVHTISETPSCYMYMFVNTTEAALMNGYKQFEEDYKSISWNKTLEKYHNDPNLATYQEILASKQVKENEAQMSLWEQFKSFITSKYQRFKRSIYLSTGAVYCLMTNDSFSKFLNATNLNEARMEQSMASEK